MSATDSSRRDTIDSAVMTDGPVSTTWTYPFAAKAYTSRKNARKRHLFFIGFIGVRPLSARSLVPRTGGAKRFLGVFPWRIPGDLAESPLTESRGDAVTRSRQPG